MRKPVRLVHGAWSGSWIWSRLAGALRAAGTAVYTPSLTGVGERVHLASPETDLDTHVLDVLNALKYEAISNVTGRP